MGHQRPDPSAGHRFLGVPPAPLTSLIGRAEETDLATSLLQQEHVRLLTLLGPGGVGKTRLAIHLAHAMTDAFDAVYYLSLAPIHEPELVLPTIARSLGLRGEDTRPLIDRLHDLLGSSRTLLVLDNVEQVIGVAPDIAALLRACPSVTVLVTSRSPLRIGGEHELVLATLAVPDPAHLPPLQQLMEYEAVALFVDRVRAVRPQFTLNATNARAVVEICGRLDGLPLALELAAARCRLLPPEALVSSLSHRLNLLTHGNRDLPPRLQTMRDAIAWSYALLTPAEQALFRRLAVFVGGFTLDAAEEVCGAQAADTLPLSTIDGIASLAEQSLLHPAEGGGDAARFAMLETIREFGIEQLVASGEEDAARRGHATWCVDLAERASAAFWGTAPGHWRSLLEPEHANLRAGLAWLLDHGEAEAALQLATAMEPAWWVLGHGGEGRSTLERALAAAPDASPALRARALAVAARLAERANDYPGAAALAGNALTIARQHREESATALALDEMASVALQLDRPDEARALLAEAIARYRRLGDHGRLGWALCTMAVLLSPGIAGNTDETCNADRAMACCHEALALFRAIGHGIGIARALHGIANLEPDAREALRCYQEALRHSWEEGAWSGLASGLEGIAPIARRNGYPDAAARLYGAAAALRNACAVPRSALFLPGLDREVAAVREQLGDAAFDAAWAEGWAMPLEQVMALATHSFDRAPAASLPPLTPRQREILDRIAAGQSNREIADALYLSVRTVEDHVSNLLTRLGAASRAELAARVLASAPLRQTSVPTRHGPGAPDG